jgi:hypothetical protein
MCKITFYEMINGDSEYRGIGEKVFPGPGTVFKRRWRFYGLFLE